MESIFNEIDKRGRKSNEFWTGCFQMNHRIIFESEVWEFQNKNLLIPITLALTEESLLKHQQGRKMKSANIKWKLIEAFVEEKENDCKYIFRVGQGSIFKEFYVATSEILDEWLYHLSTVGIMAEIGNDYNFIKEIGKGGSAKVFLAEDKETHMKYAIKACPKSLANSIQNGKSTLASEINMMRNLNHPNIVKLLKVYESEEHVFLVLEYINGGTLLDRLSNYHKYSEKNAAEIISRLLKAVDYLHSLEIVHRDIKLENILMISENNDIEFKLADFGLACEDDHELSKRCGSPGYTAPEIFSEKTYDKKVDIFSVGIVLYGLLTGTAAFPGKTAEERMRKNREGKVYFDGKPWKNISKSGIDMVSKLVSINPFERPSAQSALDHIWLRYNLKSFRKIKARSRRIGRYLLGLPKESESSTHLDIEEIDLKPISSEGIMITVEDA
ncbi:unnamed protein product [Blepharisma stoltei]|uniref:Protein kinase domain-containing protein n=1 Tax=Blepharisma stoltei TaxID=1481888 RepID=A0AAU9JV99_9CILI|nr:unnamed protein product [Blepharisma stoltei]